jgi:Ca2+-binding EF-hand superfamily protein
VPLTLLLRAFRVFICAHFICNCWYCFQVLMSKETTTARQAFDTIDVDGDGTLDRSEIRQLTRTLVSQSCYAA